MILLCKCLTRIITRNSQSAKHQDSWITSYSIHKTVGICLPKLLKVTLIYCSQPCFVVSINSVFSFIFKQN